MELLREFKKLNKGDADIAGGKGASLGEMLQAGIPVPPGYVVLSASFEKFLADTNLSAEIDAVLGTVNHTKMDTVESASEKIQELILSADMPKEIARLVTASFQNLDTRYVAVRSSATAEDSSEAAWAGQLDSFLNTTEATLLVNVKKCWASLFTPRAIFYRFEKGLEKQKISVAVVVQKMVESDTAGIAFSVHPVTEDRNQLIIEAGFGLGEAVVSGSVTPDSYVLEKTPRRILEKKISAQTRALYRGEHGGAEWRNLSKTDGERQVLSDKEILALAELVLRIENHYGFPCDIEWAHESGEFFIVQSRPITTLVDKNQEEDPTAILINKVKSMEWERLLERPFYAFTLSLFEEATRPESFEQIGISGVALKTLFFQNGHWYLHHPSLKEMDAQLENFLLKHSIIEITVGLERFKNENTEKITALLGGALSIEEKFAEIFKILTLACTYIWLAHGLESFYDRRLRDEVPQYVKNDIEKFIGDASFPKKKNEHAFFEEMMRGDATDEEIAKKFGWIKSRDGFSAPFSSEEVGQMRRELPPQQEHDPVDIPEQLRELFMEVQELVFFRTARTDIFYQLYFLARPIIQEMGTKHGVSFYEMRLCRAKSFLRGEVERYVQNLTFVYLDGDVLFQNDPIISETTVSGNEAVTGTVAYRGRVQGTVRIVKDVSELNKVQAGDILVTQMTFPSFIPAMIRAAAFVTDEGGITCHAAIVAREMRKPCIIGTKIATQVLKDGDLVEVDAEKGIVRY